MSDEKPNAEPLLADYMARWATVNVIAHEQERSAREDHSTALSAWLRAEISRLTLACRERDERIEALAKSLQFQVELNAREWKAGHDAGTKELRSQLEASERFIARLRSQFDIKCEESSAHADEALRLHGELERMEKKLSAALQESMMRDPRQQSDLESSAQCYCNEHQGTNVRCPMHGTGSDCDG